MKIVKLSQREDREAWLEFRRGKITGTKASKVRPLRIGKDKTPTGFWELVADNLAIPKDGESERDRGLRLEPESITETVKQFGLKNVDLDPGMWVSDEDERIAVSPDAGELSPKPTWGIETKSLDSKNHIKAIVMDRRAKKLDGYNPVNSLKIDSRCDFTSQVVQYFVVNPDMRRLYFSLHDDRMALDHLVHYVIVIERKHVADLVEQQMQEQKDVLKEVRALLKELKEDK